MALLHGSISPDDRRTNLPTFRWLVEPLVHTVREYTLGKLRRDVQAGLTVAVVEVPQAMAYAIIAGVPPVYGIYASVVQGVIASLFSSSQHLATGPTNTQSLLVASAVTRLVGSDADPNLYLQLVFALSILKGLVQLLFGAAGLGVLVKFVSRSVISGLVTGAGVLILVGQIPTLLGVASTSHSRWPGVIGPLHNLFTHLGQVVPLAAGVGFGCIAIIIASRVASRLIPGPLIAIVAAGGLVWAMGWTSAHLPLIHSFSAKLPTFQVPVSGFREFEGLLSGALALAAVGMIETVAIAKTMSARTGEPVSAKREFVAQGLANFISGFFQGLPGSGSFTRSALDHAAGAQTRFAAVFGALVVGAIGLLAGPLAAYVPRSSLAGVLIVIAIGLIDWRYPLKLRKVSRSDTAVYAITLVATLIAPLEYAVFIGVFLSIALYLRKSSRLHVAEMVQLGGGFVERPVSDRFGQQQVMFLQVEGDLFFAVADELRERLGSLLRADVRAVVIRLKRTHWIDASALEVLEQFTRDMNARHRHVILCGVRPELMDVLRNYGLISALGEKNVFPAMLGVFSSAKEAIARARQLVDASLDTEKLEDKELRDEPLTYDI